MTETVSSAKQLYDILKKAFEQNPGNSIIQVWTKILGAKSATAEAVSKELAELFGLFDDVKQDLLKIEDKDNRDIGLTAISEEEESDNSKNLTLTN